MKYSLVSISWWEDGMTVTNKSTTKKETGTMIRSGIEVRECKGWVAVVEYGLKVLRDPRPLWIEGVFIHKAWLSSICILARCGRYREGVSQFSWNDIASSMPGPFIHFPFRINLGLETSKLVHVLTSGVIYWERQESIDQPAQLYFKGSLEVAGNRCVYPTRRN